MDQSNQRGESRELIASRVAKNLMLARTTVGLTQQALADAAEVSRATINQIENSEADPRLSTLADIAAALGISPLMLFIGEAELRGLHKLATIWRANKMPKGPTDNDIKVMNRLICSGLQKNLLRAAAIGAESVGGTTPQEPASATAPKVNPGQTTPSKATMDDTFRVASKLAATASTIAIGAAIGTALWPGIGTVMGGMIGKYLKDELQEEAKEVSERSNGR